MNILHLNTQAGGGAGIAAKRIMKALEKKGHHSDMLVLFGDNDPENNIFNFWGGKHNALQYLKMAYHPAANRIHLYGRKYKPEMFSRPQSLIDITRHELYKKADIIHLHWVAHFLDYPTFFRKNTKPIIWTMHDQNPFTGGCHYSFDCSNFLAECKNCPQSEGSFFPNYALKNQQIKQDSFNHKIQPYVTAPSGWLSGLAANSLTMKHLRHKQIPNGADTKIFSLKDKSEIRKKFNLPANKKILLFVSEQLGKKYKGFHILLEVLNQIDTNDILLLALGKKSNLQQNLDIDLREMGHISDEATMAEMYNAADLFITPSLSDNFPNTILESHLCGTPVMGFPVCGIKEMIDHGINGILCDNPDSDSMKKALDLYLNDFYKFDNHNIAAEAAQKYGYDTLADNYIKIYEEILKQT